MLNDKGQVLNTQKIPINHNRLEWVSSVNALNHSRIGFCNSSISLSGGILGTISESGIRDIPVSERMDMQNKEWETTLTYPIEYYDNNFGSVYLNRIYTASDNNNYFLYGFPIEPQIYRFNSDFSVCDTVHVQSRYDKGLTTCMNNQEEIEDDGSLEIQYFVSQLSYSDILYDPYRHLYIRAVNHPIEGWKRNHHFIQPRSFIIVNETGEVLSESRKLTDCADLDFGNMHICSDGLLIAQTCEDENYIQFRCYNIRNK